MDDMIHSELIALIHTIRGKRVMLDRDLGKLYGVETKILNKAVNRNIERFPDDFMFLLTNDETAALRFQIGTLKRGQHSKYLPSAYTENGVAMLSSVLNSPSAIQINIRIMRTFTHIREIASSHKALLAKINELESKYDNQFQVVFQAIQALLVEEEPPKKKIGFI